MDLVALLTELSPAIALSAATLYFYNNLVSRSMEEKSTTEERLVHLLDRYDNTVNKMTAALLELKEDEERRNP